jgi:hypothetical protein
MWRISLILIAFLLAPAVVSAGEGEYPSNLVERPLTLPESVVEFGLGFDYSRYGNMPDYPFYILRYGISDNLEFYFPIGLKYRFADVGGDHEPAVKAAITGFGGPNTYYASFEVGLEDKHRLRPGFALIYKFEGFYSGNTEGDNMSELRGTVGGIYAVTDEFALSVYGVYRSMYGLDVLELEEKVDSDETAAIVSAFYNITPDVDITFDGSFNNFSGPSRNEGHFTNSEEVYTLTFAWRR